MLKKILKFLFPPKKKEFDKFDYAVSKVDDGAQNIQNMFDNHDKLLEEGKTEEAHNLFFNVITPAMKDYLTGTKVMINFLKI